MTDEEMKNKYGDFITKISEILGLGRPVDILKLCATTDLFFQPLDKRIAELEKENAELKNKVTFLEDNLRVARKDREKLQLDVAKGLKEFIKDYPATSLRYLANEKYVEQLTKAKDLLVRLSTCLEGHSNNNFEYELIKQAEQFLNSEVEK